MFELVQEFGSAKSVVDLQTFLVFIQYNPRTLNWDLTQRRSDAATQHLV